MQGLTRIPIQEACTPSLSLSLTSSFLLNHQTLGKPRRGEETLPLAGPEHLLSRHMRHNPGHVVQFRPRQYRWDTWSTKVSWCKSSGGCVVSVSWEKQNN